MDLPIIQALKEKQKQELKTPISGLQIFSLPLKHNNLHETHSRVLFNNCLSSKCLYQLEHSFSIELMESPPRGQDVFVYTDNAHTSISR